MSHVSWLVALPPSSLAQLHAPRTQRRPRGTWATALAALMLLAGCSEAPLPERILRRDDCLRDVRLDNLKQALSTCNQVVARFPADPAPRHERSLLHRLAGDDTAACRDSAEASRLLQQAKPGSVDRLLHSELTVRQRSCLTSG